MHKNIVLIGNIFSLFLYLMLTDEDKRKESIFIFDVTFDKNFIKNFRNFYQCYYFYYESKFSKLLHKIFMFIYFCYLKIVYKSVMVYGQDHVDAARILFNRIFRKWKFYLLEDGAGNYVNIDEIKEHSINYNYLVMGFNDRVEKIILTTKLDVDNHIKDKIVRVDLVKLWEEKSLNEKSIIIKIYNLESFNFLNFENCIVTQPFARNNCMTYKEQLELYKKIVLHYSHQNTFIKVHPLDDFLYSVYFPEYYIMNNRVPLEFLLLVYSNITKIITINSSVANFDRENITVEYYNFDGELRSIN